MRTLLLVALVLAGLLFGVAFLSGGERANRAEAPPEAVPAAPDGVEAREEGALGTAREVEHRTADATPPVGESVVKGRNGAPAPTPEKAPERPTSTRDEGLEAIWLRCVDETEGDALRACLREQLEGLALAPEDLAALVCGEVPPDGFDQIFVEEVAATWPPDDAPRRIRAFQRSCNEPGKFWTGFVELQARRDPVWLESFARSLLDESLGEDDDLALLFCAKALAAEGDEAMAAHLDACARGELGSSDAQVAFAISNAYALRADGADGLAFLTSVAHSPSFQGRPAEVRALGRCLLEGSPKAFDPERTYGVVLTLLDDPVVGPGLAAHVRDLVSWNRMPLWLSEAQRDTLADRTRDG